MGGDAVTTKMKLQNYHSAMFECTKMFIHPLQPSCDAQDVAICWQVDQMGHTSQHVYSRSTLEERRIGVVPIRLTYMGNPSRLG